MRIIIDARMYGLENAGIGRYTINLVDQIQKLDTQNTYLLLLSKKYYLGLSIKNPKFIKVLADYSHYSLKEQILLPIQLIKLKPDLVHFPHFNTPIFYFGRYVVTIHDLIKHFSLGPETTTRKPWLYWLKYVGYKIVFKFTVIKAKKILVPSYTVKKELAEYYHLAENKILVTYEGVDKKFEDNDTEDDINSLKIFTKYHIKEPFVIYTGSVYPHKNINRLIQAIKLLDKKTYLVISSSRNVFYTRLFDKIKSLNAEDLVNLVGFVPDEEIIYLYKKAKAFIFPTLSEGFGLPGLEAMAVSCPVICSDIPVLREIYGDAALYFNPLDISDISEKILQVIDNRRLQGELREKGLQQVRKYSWKKMAELTLEQYKQVL